MQTFEDCTFYRDHDVFEVSCLNPDARYIGCTFMRTPTYLEDLMIAKLSGTLASGAVDVSHAADESAVEFFPCTFEGVRAKDCYDEAIEYLTEHPDEIVHAWGWYDTHVAGCLFQFAGGPLDVSVGCLTQVREGTWCGAATPELTRAIRADIRIPRQPDEITVDDLPVFAEWQRRLDKELGRAPWVKPTPVTAHAAMGILRASTFDSDVESPVIPGLEAGILHTVRVGAIGTDSISTALMDQAGAVSVTIRERDAYDDAIDYLTENPDRIMNALYRHSDNPGSCLFDFVTPSRECWYEGFNYSCPMMIREHRGAKGYAELLTDGMRNDERLPRDRHDITVDHLPIFAEWQRRIDKELGRTPPPKRDKYDKAIDYLRENPDELRNAWFSPNSHEAGCLFQFTGVGPTKNHGEIPDEIVGCLTMIRDASGQKCVAATQELTDAILLDDRIPTCLDDTTVDDLPVFAEWQRKLDKELNRV